MILFIEIEDGLVYVSKMSDDKEELTVIKADFDIDGIDDVDLTEYTSVHPFAGVTYTGKVLMHEMQVGDADDSVISAYNTYLEAR